MLGSMLFSDDPYSRKKKRFHSLVYEMESGVPVKPEPVWLLEDEAVVSSLKTEEDLDFETELKLEKTEPESENTHQTDTVKEDMSVTSSVLSNDCFEEVKTEIEIEENAISVDCPGLSPRSSTDVKPRATDQSEEVLHTSFIETEIHNGKRSVENSTSDLDVNIQENQLDCEYCGKHCTSLSKLTIHLRSHTREKPFKCEHCSKCFTALSHLTDHIRTHTGFSTVTSAATSGDDVLPPDDPEINSRLSCAATSGPSMPTSAEPRQKRSKLEEFENEITSGLSLCELQRYVLLKQVKIMNMQERKNAKREAVLKLEEEELKKRQFVLNLQLQKLLWGK